MIGAFYGIVSGRSSIDSSIICPLYVKSHVHRTFVEVTLKDNKAPTIAPALGVFHVPSYFRESDYVPALRHR
jgi:hypothetical protein